MELITQVPQTDLRSLPPGCSRGGEDEKGPQGCLRWACDLRSLLCDHEGLQLLEAFLEQEGADTGCLSFWYACNGFRSCDDPEVKLQVRDGGTGPQSCWGPCSATGY